MIKQVVAYAAVFLLTLYCYFLYDDEIIAMMLIVELFYPVVSFAWTNYLKKRTSILLGNTIPIEEKGKKIPITVFVKNRTKILPIHIKIKLQVENSFTGEKVRFQQEKTIKAGDKGKIIIDLQANQCGNLDVILTEWWIYDLLFVFRQKIKSKERQRISVLPECHLIPVEVTRKTKEFLAEADEYSDRESGDDSSETYQIREYRERDFLRDVHWKLSAKADELLVKEHGRPLGSVILIWLNFKVDHNSKKNVSDKILEAVASLSASLLEAKCVHTVAWYEVENKRIQKRIIRKEEHIYELLCRLLYTRPFKEDVDIQFEEAFRGVAFSTEIEFLTDGTVIINKEERRQIPEKWDEFYFIV